jgi:choline dehydrogenase-like flavoprotein
MPSAAALLGRMPRAVRALARPLFGMVWQKRVQPLTVLATIMEDLPYAQNRVLPAAHFNDGTRQRVRLRYRPSAYDLARNAAFRRVLTRTLAPLRPYSVDLGRDNTAIAHVCGSCRFGSDPATSVLDADNRAHGIDNLYVVDASFFPSSSGTNPALTIAANALRVAAHLRDRI